MTEKTIKILECTKKIEEILQIIRPDNNWEIAYDTPEHVDLTDWDRKYLQLIDGEDYFFIFVDGSPLYAVNVTGDSIICALYELIELLSRKF